MHRNTAMGWALLASLVLCFIGISPDVSAQGLKVAAEQTATGFAYPESVAYDPQAKVLYVSEFVSELKPAQKDGKGRISKVSLSGEILEAQFLPAPGDTLHKPKGIWVKDNWLWVTDIDVVWVFDLETRKGRKVELTGITFANDPTLVGNALYVSDNRADQLYRVEPADFLNMQGDPKVTRVFADKSVNPNGLYPAKDGSLLMVGFKSADEARGIYSLSPGGEPKALSQPIGRLDGVYQMEDGSLLVTDWKAGALASWDAKSGMQTLASGFKGPADFCVVPDAKTLTVVVPDLVKGELRIVQLAP
jgi:hypothetical protein